MQMIRLQVSVILCNWWLMTVVTDDRDSLSPIQYLNLTTTLLTINNQLGVY